MYTLGLNAAQRNAQLVKFYSLRPLKAERFGGSSGLRGGSTDSLTPKAPEGGNDLADAFNINLSIILYSARTTLVGRFIRQQAAKMGRYSICFRLHSVVSHHTP